MDLLSYPGAPPVARVVNDCYSIVPSRNDASIEPPFVRHLQNAHRSIPNADDVEARQL
jgi:hypothetical protein